MKTRFAKRLIKFLSLRTIYSKTILTFAIFAMVILFFMTLSVTSTITKLEEDLIADRLVSDINYIEDLISGNNKTANWEIKDGSIYFGDVLIGDGTEETANFAPFLEHEEKTGTLAYVFLLDKDAQMGYVEQTDIARDTAKGITSGWRAAPRGRTANPSSEPISRRMWRMLWTLREPFPEKPSSPAGSSIVYTRRCSTKTAISSAPWSSAGASRSSNRRFPHPSTTSMCS